MLGKAKNFKCWGKGFVYKGCYFTVDVEWDYHIFLYRVTVSHHLVHVAETWDMELLETYKGLTFSKIKRRAMAQARLKARSLVKNFEMV